MNYCYGKGVQNCVFCWEIVPISKVLYWRFHRSYKVSKKTKNSSFSAEVLGNSVVIMSDQGIALARGIEVQLTY